MTMSSINEQEGIKDLLRKLTNRELISLGKTVTQGLKKIRSADDAIEAIVKYSPDVLTILRRKVVTRELLFNYLEEKNVEIKLPITKYELVDRIVQLWGVTRSAADIASHSSQTEDAQCSDISECEDEQTSNGGKNNTVEILAEQFCTWIFSMINGDGVGAEHFFPDAKLTMNLFANGNVDTTVVEDNPEEIADTINQIKLQHNLFFNPNITKEGVQGRMNPHGLVMVLVCGTLHVHETCAGVFEQVFALARDPFSDNNWKIKICDLNLRNRSGVFGPPRLSDSDLTSNLLMLPSN